eukprot:TRINITY_DN4390_c5_g1_i2.p1 TRINITY_DN4390_c5_g1~~TRINITY_DN4390_c5_g1_i2.p1  ORF type:complete len:538 (+),score=49.28 TRINITY_DN4390_c5_g1_i2:58-1671(+)
MEAIYYGATRAKRHLVTVNTERLVTALSSFRGCEELLRATPLNAVLQRGGSILACSDGSASTYNLSERVGSIDVFLSHNWCVSRTQKFVALSYYFNLETGTLCACLTSLLICILSLSGVAPTMNSAYDGKPYGFLCRLCCVPVFILVVLGISDAKMLLGMKSPCVFLDKTCIHQEDRDIQRAGIEKLAAFLYKSDRMVVLYSSMYTRKLWTVYEMASFMILRDYKDIDVVSLYHTMVESVGLLLFWATSMLRLLVRTYIPLRADSWFLAQCYVAGLLYCYALRSWIRERAWMYDRLRGFDVKDCVCTVESDRPIVYRNIAALMRASGKVDQMESSASSDEHALESFNELVRTELPKVFEASLGKYSFRYKNLALLLWLFYSPACVDELANAQNEAPTQTLWLASGYLCSSFVFGPLCILTFDCVARSYEDLRGWKNMLYFVFAFHVGMVLPAAAIFYIREHLKEVSHTSTYMIVVFITFHVVAALATILLLAFRRNAVELCKDDFFVTGSDSKQARPSDPLLRPEERLSAKDARVML